MVINIALRSIWNLYSPIIACLFKSGVNLFEARAEASKLDDWDALRLFNGFGIVEFFKFNDFYF